MLSVGGDTKPIIFDTWYLEVVKIPLPEVEHASSNPPPLAAAFAAPVKALLRIKVVIIIVALDGICAGLSSLSLSSLYAFHLGFHVFLDSKNTRDAKLTPLLRKKKDEARTARRRKLNSLSLWHARSVHFNAFARLDHRFAFSFSLITFSLCFSKTKQREKGERHIILDCDRAARCVYEWEWEFSLSLAVAILLRKGRRLLDARESRSLLKGSSEPRFSLSVFGVDARVVVY